MTTPTEFWRALQQQLSNRLASVVPDGSRVIYLDIPVHKNIGDLLIYLGTRAWLRGARHEVLGVWSWRQFGFPDLDPDVIVLAHGGGNLGDIYPEHEALRRKVIARYPRNRIVVLPQSVHFDDPAGQAVSAAVYGAHTDLHVFCRDHVSAELMAGMVGEANVVLSPDMATFLYPLRSTLSLPPPPAPRGTLYLMRRDVEAVADRRIGDATSGDRIADWVDLTGLPWRVGSRLMIEIERMPLEADASRRYDRAWAVVAARMARRCAGMMLAHRHVTTSRLHGHIMAALLDVESTVLDNRYGKNTRYFEAWHRDLPTARLAPAPHHVEAAGPEALLRPA